MNRPIVDKIQNVTKADIYRQGRIKDRTSRISVRFAKASPA